MSMSSPAHSESEGESSGDDPLFEFKPRGAFKRRRNSEDGDNDDDADERESDRSRGKGDSDDESSGEDGSNSAAFDSSPDMSGRHGGAFADLKSRLGGSAIRLDSSSEDEGKGGYASSPKRKLLDEAAMQELARREADELVASASVGVPYAATSDETFMANKRFNSKIRADLEDASRVDVPDVYPSSMHPLSAWAASRSGTLTSGERERRLKKSVRIKVIHGRKSHFFNTRLGRELAVLLESCRHELLDRGERGAELSLSLEGRILDITKNILDAGVMEDVELHLEVKGQERACSGPSVKLKVRVQGGKTLDVEASMDMRFSSFVERFCEAVGVPDERINEVVMTFDGDRLDPDGTPEDAEMEAENLIDAKVPCDLLEGIRSSPNELNLVGKPMKARRPAASVPSAPSRPIAEEAREGGHDAATGSARRSARPVAPAGGAASVGRPMTRSRSTEAQTEDAEVIVVD